MAYAVRFDHNLFPYPIPMPAIPQPGQFVRLDGTLLRVKDVVWEMGHWRGPDGPPYFTDVWTCTIG